MKIYTIDEYLPILETRVTSEKYIRNELERGFCEFTYTKKNGEQRTAFGTNKPDFIKDYWTPSKRPVTSTRRNGINKLKDLGFIQYFDLERMNFRQFRIESNVDLVKCYTTIKELADDHPVFANLLNDDEE